MIDWLTLKIDVMKLNQEAFDRFYQNRSKLCMVDPQGNVVWERPTRESVRSDSHQLTVEFGTHLIVYGSPARLLTGDHDNVFGSDSIRECAQAMVKHLEQTLAVKLPEYQMWQCKRIDVTENYFLGSLLNVKQALEMVRNAEGGRFQLRVECESVYWSTKSKYRSGKAYSKGQHLAFLIKRGKLLLDEQKLQAAAGLLRLELSLRTHWFSKICKKSWYLLTPNDLATEHNEYFSKLVGDCEVSEMSDLQQKFADAALSLGLNPGQGRACFGSWNWIQSYGYNDWKEGVARSTFYRHRKIMMKAGLSYADFQNRKVVPIRKRRVVLDRPVKSWSELLKVA